MLVGDKVNRLTLIRVAPAKRHARGVFRCDCGIETRPITVGNVARGKQKSCGCLNTKAQRGKCVVDGCVDLIWYVTKGYCLAHYKRFWKYGDPNAGAIRHGSAQRFIAEAIASETDACITFPYFRDREGYARAKIEGRSRPVAPYVLERCRGPKPNRNLECCHSCGKGNEGCINPHHLYWGTRRDNVTDAIAHGTFMAGYRPRPGLSNPKTKVTAEMVLGVRERLAKGDKQAIIAKYFGTTQSIVSKIKLGWPENSGRALTVNNSDPGAADLTVPLVVCDGL